MKKKELQVCGKAKHKQPNDGTKRKTERKLRKRKRLSIQRRFRMSNSREMPF